MAMQYKGPFRIKGIHKRRDVGASRLGRPGTFLKLAGRFGTSILTIENLHSGSILHWTIDHRKQLQFREKPLPLIKDTVP
jgi:hypothetical protein